MYFCNVKHRAVAYANIKTAFADNVPSGTLETYLKDFYRSFGQTLIEFFLFPLVDKKYLNKYITFEGLDNIAAGFKRGKGVILAVMHEGSWEISNIISANLGYPFSIVVRDQPRYNRLNRLLNISRSQKGTKLIETKDQTKRIIEVLRKNEAIAMTVDQGGMTGSRVRFFGKNASMSTGAVRLALKLGATIIPVFSTRINAGYIKFIIGSPFEVRETGDKEKDISENLQRLVGIFERYIAQYPKEYLWTYKIWKYTNQKNVMIISDAKAGHLRQSQAVAGIMSGCLEGKGESVKIETVEIKLKSALLRLVLTLSCAVTGKYSNLAFRLLRLFLGQAVFESFSKIKPDIVISCGSSLSALNLAVCRVNLAKSVVVMRPSILSTDKFALVIMSKHDRPPERNNVAVIEGALNLINEKYLESQAGMLRRKISISKKFIVGLLIGGDTKSFRLDRDATKNTIIQLKNSLESIDAEILVTTSRRTSREIESLVRGEFGNYPRCILNVIANENNLPEAIGGILGLSHLIVTSAESISMISEAVNSKKYVLVFGSAGIDAKHKRFLELFSKNKYIYLTEPADIAAAIENIRDNKPQRIDLKDNFLVGEAIKKIL